MFDLDAEQGSSETNEYQTSVMSFVEEWLRIHGVPVKRRSLAVGVDDRTYRRLRTGERTLRSDQVTNLAHALQTAPYYLGIAGSLALSAHQMRAAITDSARYQVAIEQMFALPEEERNILFRNLLNLTETAAIKRRELVSRGDF